MRGRWHIIEHLGQPMSLRELADTIGIARGTIRRRWSKGDRGERLMRAPDPKKRHRGQR